MLYDQMKQKRKVKSLLPQKFCLDGKVLTGILLFLSVILCIWSVSLMTHSVWAINEQGPNTTYSVTLLFKNKRNPSTNMNNASKTYTWFMNWSSYSINSPEFEFYEPDRPVVTGVINWHNVTDTVYYTPITGHDINDDGFLDDVQGILLKLITQYYPLGEAKDICPRETIYNTMTDLEPLSVHVWSEYNIDVSKYCSVDWYSPEVDVLSWIIMNPGRTDLEVNYSPLPGHDLNDNGIADEYEIKLTINYVYIKNGRERPITGSYEEIAYYWYRYDVDSPEIQFYEPDKVNVEWELLGNHVEKVVYTPKQDLNENGLADEEENLQEITGFDYTWLDNNVEVIYGMQFVDPLILQKIVNNIYMSGSNLYIASNPVILDSSNNRVGTGIYSHILWWEENEVDSNNITLIAWEGNKIHSWYDNLSILWWVSNVIGSGGGFLDIVIWWIQNILEDYFGGNALIWWNSNVIVGAKNSFVLWWDHNGIWSSDIGNLIIWWSHVSTNVDSQNIFVYSNSANFTPETNNAFYLNAIGGVWINTGWVDWLSVGWAVSFGEIDIMHRYCENDRLWIKWTYSGCLVWCTKVSREDSKKWEMLDQGNRCAQLCKDNASRCLYTEIADIVEVPDSPAQCTAWVDTGNADLCITDLDSYKNVFFETTLIDSDAVCPTDTQDICVYKCRSGFHLKEGHWGHVKCYADCLLPWDESQKIEHNDTVTWYNIDDVDCSNDIYVFPLNTEINNMWHPVASPIYQRWSTTINGVTYTNRAKNWKSYESCGNYDHKKTLICNDWELYLMGSDGYPTGTTWDAAKYNKESCNLHSYKCDTWVYKLTEQQIINEKKDHPKNGNWAVADRWVLNGERWIYTWCIDYDVNPDPTKNGESCSVGVYHYAFIKCQSGYILDEDDGICKKDCSLIGSNGNSVLYQQGDVVTAYTETWVRCPNVCTGSQLVCDDGVWKLWSSNGSTVTGVWYNYCKSNKKDCGSSYNVNSSLYDTWKETWIYDDCEKYNVNGSSCVPNWTVYKLVDCKTGYHTEDMKICTSNTWYVPCLEAGWTSNSHYIIKDVKVTWEGWWNTGHWTDAEYCDWECNTGYIQTGDRCVSDACGTSRYTCLDSGVNATNMWPIENGYSWNCLDRECLDCALGYTGVNWECVKIEDGKCGTGAYVCDAWKKHDRDETDEQYNWDCLWVWSWTTDDLWCFACKNWYTPVGDHCAPVSVGCSSEHYWCKDWSEWSEQNTWDIEWTWKCWTGDYVIGCHECRTDLWYVEDDNWICVNSNELNSYKICRELKTLPLHCYAWGGTPPPVSASLNWVTFWVVDRRPMPVDVKINQSLNQYDSETNSSYNPNNPYLTCTELEVISQWEYESETQTNKQSCFVSYPASRSETQCHGKFWSLGGDFQLAEVPFLPGLEDSIELVGDCYEPRCGTEDNTCDVWFPVDHGILLNGSKRSCVYGSNKVNCKYKCESPKCPAGYKLDINTQKCKLHAEYCAQPSTYIPSCTYLSTNSASNYASSSCNGDANWVAGGVDGDPVDWPKRLYRWTCSYNELYYGDTPFSDAILRLDPKDSSIMCSITWDILDECFNYLTKYNQRLDNWYYITNCDSENVPLEVDYDVCWTPSCHVTQTS